MFFFKSDISTVSIVGQVPEKAQYLEFSKSSTREAVAPIETFKTMISHTNKRKLCDGVHRIT